MQYATNVIASFPCHTETDMHKYKANEYVVERFSSCSSSNKLFKFMQFNLVLLILCECKNTNTHVNLDLIVLKCAPFFIEMTMHFYAVMVAKRCNAKLIGDLASTRHILHSREYKRAVSLAPCLPSSYSPSQWPTCQCTQHTYIIINTLNHPLYNAFVLRKYLPFIFHFVTRTIHMLSKWRKERK